MKIESQPNSPQDCLKVIYEGKHGKLFPLEGLTYDEFIKRLYHVYKLPPVHSSNYYHLYFIDSDKDSITIRDQEDFSTFMEIAGRKKLYLTHTNNEDLHFQKQKPQQQKLAMSQEEIDRIINEKRQQLLIKIQQRVSSLKEALRKEMEKLIDRPKIKMPIHEGIICKKCDGDQSITGTRYQCIICNYNICQQCEQTEEHPHPLFKIRNESQCISIKKNMLLFDVNVKNYAQYKAKKMLSVLPAKKKQMPPFYEQFKTITNLSDQKAQAIIESHPKMSHQQLIQYFFANL